MKNKILKSAVGAVLATAMLSGCVGSESGEPGSDASGSGGTLIVGGPLEPRALNPAVQTGTVTNIPGSQLFASPVLLDENLEPQPYGADSWAFSDDGLTLTLQLRDDIVFHDGTVATAEDLVFSIEVVKEHHPQGGILYGNVADVQAEGSNTVVLTLTEPSPAILKAMTPMITPILPKAIYGDGQDITTHPRNSADVVGSGPYKLKEFSAGDKLVLTRHEDFFLSEKVSLENIIIKFLPDQDTAAMALQNNEINMMVSYDPTIADRLSSMEGIEVAAGGYEGQGTLNLIELNTKNEYLSDTRVRQAISYSIDRDAIIEDLHRGYSKRATGPIYPDGHFFDASATNSYELDLKKAEALLDEAGFKAGADGTRFALRFDFMPGSDVMGRNVAETVADQLSKVGIEIELRPAPDFATWAERVSNYDFDLTMDNISNGPDPVLIAKTYSCANIRPGVVWANMTQYCNEEVDDLFSRGAQEADATKRYEIYSELQRIITDEAPVIYLETQPIINIYSSKVKNAPNGKFGLMFPVFDTVVE